MEGTLDLVQGFFFEGKRKTSKYAAHATLYWLVIISPVSMKPVYLEFLS